MGLMVEGGLGGLMGVLGGVGVLVEALVGCFAFLRGG